ncbi:hypothetical protein OESDEN_05070 [Oesophagostomum dentatum]|uniref:7TM GPCR serpentine receptor class x (Srx) domain-containing protein n=1 Tax=Oesophagostomum dentatum TaxID=61180 RepID=A0A0B1TFU6_OESDE|nr:hypothetical protein OESDEN_05070 [Oesophagostomum dentatum]
MEWLMRAGGNAENIRGYDCRNSSRSYGVTNYVIGTSLVAYGVIIEIVYILDLIVMVRRQHRRLSCYKIMIALGMSLRYCWNLNQLLAYWLFLAYGKQLLYITHANVCIWVSSQTNAFESVGQKKTVLQIFKGGRTYAALVVPIVYGIYFWLFTTPVLFNSDHTAWFFFTFVPGHNMEDYYNYPHSFNNIFVVFMTCMLYVLYARAFLRFSRAGGGLTWAQKSFFVQCSSICTANLTAAFVYVYIQFLPTPSYFILLGHVSWQLSNGNTFIPSPCLFFLVKYSRQEQIRLSPGIPAFVYLFLNRTIQRDVLLMLGIRKHQVTSSTLSKNTDTK